MRRTSWTRPFVFNFAVSLYIAAPMLATAAEEPAPLAKQDLADITPVGEPADRAPMRAGDGTVELVVERYPDGNVKVERHVTLDAEGNYVNHGTWKMWTATGTVIAEGQFDMGKRVGIWTRWHGRPDSPLFSQFPFNRFKPPFSSHANYIEGKLDGEWLVVDADGKKCLQVSLNNGQRNGPVITWLPNGKTYRQAMYEQGVPAGEVLEFDSKKSDLVVTDTFVEGRRVISKSTNYPRGKQKQSEEMFLEAVTVQKSRDDFWNFQFAEYGLEGTELQHGPTKTWYENGQVQHEGFYEFGKKTGTFTTWHANGQIASVGEYKDDMPHDLWTWWHENGQKSAVGKYDGGTLIAEWRWWDENGQLAKQESYDGSEGLAADKRDMIEIGRTAPTGERILR